MSDLHRWTHGKPLVRHNTDERIEQGDRFEATEAEIRAFGDRIEEVDAGETDTADTGEEDTVAFDEDAWFDDHEDYTERADTVKLGDVDAVLDKIEEVETSDTVVEAVQARRDELEG